MDILEIAWRMLSKYPLCDHCMGRQFALLGYGIENNYRGKALKLGLVLQASALNSLHNTEGVARLEVLALNGFSREAQETLHYLKKNIQKKNPLKTCYLCENRFQLLNDLTQKALDAIANYEFSSFLVGVELPVAIEEREDEFRAAFNVSYGENVKHEFGRLLGKQIVKAIGKTVEYKKPNLTIIVNPFAEQVKVEVNPLFVAGRYRKLVRNIPQSRWFCSSCRGKGCKKCGGSGKMYPESVEELASTLLLEATEGDSTSFHASGREDIDARMLGSGRPFVIEVSRPKKRFLDLKKLEATINLYAEGRIEVSDLRFTSKDFIRRLKKGESSQKEYRVLIDFERAISEEDLSLLEEKLSGLLIKQQTPLRVLHRRADLIREKYIYEVKVKKVSPKRAEMEIRCQGGLYVKELVSGDGGRTSPNVSELLENRAKPLKLDVLNIIMEDKNIGEF